MSPRPADKPAMLIDQIVEPFRDVAPVPLETEPQPGVILLATKDDMRGELPGINRRMLAAAFERFLDDREQIRARVRECLGQEMDAVDAIVVGLREATDRRFTHAAIDNPAFTQAQREYKFFFKQTGYANRENPFESLTKTVRHGMETLIALQEVVPTVFRRKHKKMPTLEQLHALIPASTENILTGMLKTNAGFALDVENAMGLQARLFVVDGQEDIRPSFAPDNLVLRDTEEGEELDVTPRVVAKMAFQPPETLDHVGCLATRTNITASSASPTKANLFSAVKKFTVELLQTEWFPRIARGSKRPQNA